MDTHVQTHDTPGDEGNEGENGQAQDNALVSYNNRAPPSDTQLLIDRYMEKTNFNMKSEDLDKPWFHEGITRAMAQEMLKGKEQGSYVVRPSSHRGSYAMSWVKNEQTGEISHSLIHGLFPGFSLKQTPSLEERFWTLQSLVDSCPHLVKPIVSDSYVSNTKSTFQRNIARTCSEVVGRIVEKLYANNPALTEIKWNICILGEASELFTANTREKRTFVRYCDEEYAAPELLPFSENGVGLVCQALHTNTTLRTLTINGHEGYMLLNFKPDLGDADAAMIGKMLSVNKTLTSLTLNVNGITDAGAKSIAQGLTFNRTLRKLHLSHNFMGAEGLSYFSELLKTNYVLEECDVTNQLHYNGSTSFVARSCGENVRHGIALIDDALRRRAELLPLSSASGSLSLSSPARSSFLSVFHGFLSKKKVERRLASHIPGSFLFYLNRFLPNVLFIGVVQDVPHSHGQLGSAHSNSRKVIVHKRVQRTRQGYIFSGDAPHFQHEIEAITRPPAYAAKQIVPTLFEHCAWYISSKNKLYAEHLPSLTDDVTDLFRAVQQLIGLWGVKYTLSPHAPSTVPSHASTSHKGKSGNTVHHHYADQPEPEKPERSHRSHSSHSNGHSSSGSRSGHSSSREGHSSRSSHGHSSRSGHSSSRSSSSRSAPSPQSSPVPNGTSDASSPHYSTLSPQQSENGETPPPTPPLSNSANGTPSLSDSSPSISLNNSADNITSSLSSSDPFATNPTPVLNVTPPSSGTESDSNTDSDSNSQRPLTNHTQNHNPNSNGTHQAHHNHTNHHNHTPTHQAHHTHHSNHTNHHSQAHHTSSARPNGLPAHMHSNANVFISIGYLVHKNKSWLKYPVQIPQDTSR